MVAMTVDPLGVRWLSFSPGGVGLLLEMGADGAKMGAVRRRRLK